MSLGSNQNVTPKLHSLQVTQSLYGISIPIGAGTFRVPGNILWWGDFNANGKVYKNGGKGLGKGASQYDYQASVLLMLCGVPLTGLGNVWGQNGRLTLKSVTESYAVPIGGGSYTVGNPDLYNADQGVSVTTPYSVTANDYGSPGPVTLAGNTQTVLGTGITGYTMPTPGVYAFAASSTAAGSTVQITYSFSLYNVATTEDYNIPNTPPYEITVINQHEWYGTISVIFVDTGLPLSPVGGTPTLTGTYNPNGGNYLFASVDAVRPVAITYEWRQSQSSINPSATLSFTLIEGTQDQLPWDYLISKHLSQAIGYTGIACVGAAQLDLGPSGQMDNFNFECYGPFQFGGGIIDADMTVWIQNFLQNQLWGAQFPGTIDASLSTICRDYWAANSFFGSPLLDSGRPAGNSIDEWCEAGNVGVFWSDKSLKFIPYGDTTQVGNGYVFSPQTSPVVDLNDLDFIVEGNEDPIEIERSPWQDASNEVHIQFSNRGNNYDDDSVILQDDNAVSLYGLRPEGQKDYTFLKTIAAANFAASVRLKRLVNIRRKFKFKISGIRYCFLEPMDMVTLTDQVAGLIKEPVRIIEIDEDEKRVYSITAEEFPWGTATATLYPKQPVVPPPPPPMMSQPGDTVITKIFEPPTAVSATVANSPYQIWTALTGGPNWGGCVVMLSTDGTTYEQIGQQTGTSRGGSLTASLPAHADPDNADTLAVSTSGQLFNVTLAQLNSFATLSKCGYEYIAYQNAVLTGSSGLSNEYNLTALRRGVFSTPILAHEATEDFVRIDSQLFQYSYNPSMIGTLIYFKFLSFNLMGQMQQGLDDVSAFAYLVGGGNTSQNMTLTAVDLGGGSWGIEVYQVGQPVGTAGSAVLSNGAIITLPGTTITGLAASTTYWVTYNISTSAYVTFTSNAAYQAALSLGNAVGIGSVMTLGGTAFSPTSPGYTTQADGTVFEWGTTPTISGATPVSYPIPLPAGNNCPLASTYGSIDRILYVPSKSNFGFTAANNGSGVAASWMAVGGSGSLTTLGSGVKIQWGTSPVISGSVTLTFGSAFASAPLVFVSTVGPADRIPYVTASGTTSFTVQNNGSGCNVFWIAITGTSGEDTLSNGILIKWGTVSISGGTSVSYTNAFLSNCWTAVACTDGSTDRITFVTAFSTSGLTIDNNGSGVAANWIAIGN